MRMDTREQRALRRYGSHRRRRTRLCNATAAGLSPALAPARSARAPEGRNTTGVLQVPDTLQLPDTMLPTSEVTGQKPKEASKRAACSLGSQRFGEYPRPPLPPSSTAAFVDVQQTAARPGGSCSPPAHRDCCSVLELGAMEPGGWGGNFGHDDLDKLIRTWAGG